MDPDLPRDVTLAIAFMIAVCFVYFVWSVFRGIPETVGRRVLG